MACGHSQYKRLLTQSADCNLSVTASVIIEGLCLVEVITPFTASAVAKDCRMDPLSYGSDIQREYYIFTYLSNNFAVSNTL